MVALLVALTIIALVAADYFLLRPRRAAHPAEEDIPLPGLEPLSAALSRLPAGVFLQPTFTWSRIRPDGDILLGVHPLLFGLVGAPYDVERLPGGERVEKGAPLLRIRKGNRRLTVRSPVAGRIAEVNRVVSGETDWTGLQGDGGSWLYRIVPERVAGEVPAWFIGESAVEWTRLQYQRLREQLAALSGGHGLAATMADGGEIPVGILMRLDDAQWTAFERAVLGN